MTSKTTITLGYDYDLALEGARLPIKTDITPQTNSHMLVCGMSGSGKSYYENAIFCKLAMAEPDGEFFFADYKGDDSFDYLRRCPRYFSYRNTLQALDAVHARLNSRLAGDDQTRHPITLIWDEYMANILALTNEDKKLAAATMNKVSEILLMGRSMGVRLISSMQRPDALAFPAGSRLNYGVVVVLGAALRSIYEMLLPDHMDQVKGRQFGRGEGVVLLQGSELYVIKVPAVKDVARMQSVCIRALSPPQDQDTMPPIE